MCASGDLASSAKTSGVAHTSVIIVLKPVMRLETLPDIGDFATRMGLPDEGKQSAGHQVDHGRLSPMEGAHDEFTHGQAYAIAEHHDGEVA